VLVVDAANVLGSRPTGWWRDRAGAAHDFVERVRSAVIRGALAGPVVIVLEGQARAGVAESGAGDGVEVVHASGSGDDLIVELVAGQTGWMVVTADRDLSERVRPSGARVLAPSRFLEVLGT
jgi:hypothetical protein